MQKENRLATITKIISAGQIGRQEELVALLEKKGFVVTQSSVSRDLDELGIIKAGRFYEVPKKTASAGVFGLSSLDTAGENMIVARSESGLASAVAVKIDSANLTEIVGTIAGDDTIFIAVKNRNDQKIVIKKIWEIFEK